MLLWLAYANLHVSFYQTDGNLASDAADLLRSPDKGEPVERHMTYVQDLKQYYTTTDSGLGRLVLQTIIPTIQYMSDTVAFKLGNIFSSDLLGGLKIPSDALCSDLASSDALFDSLPSKYVIHKFVCF